MLITCYRFSSIAYLFSKWLAEWNICTIAFFLIAICLLNWQKIGPKVKLIKNSRRKNTINAASLYLHVLAWKTCEVHFVVCKAQMPYDNENKKQPRNILKSRIKLNPSLRKIYAWWWFQGEQPGHSAYVLDSVIDAGMQVCGCVRKVPMPTVCPCFPLVPALPTLVLLPFPTNTFPAALFQNLPKWFPSIYSNLPFPEL